MTEAQKATFARWYSTFPNKVGRGAAEKSWATIDPDDALVDRMVAAVAEQVRWRTAANGDFRPPWKNPATWLNQKCWEDAPAPDSASADDDEPQYKPIHEKGGYEADREPPVPSQVLLDWETAHPNG